MVAPNITPPNGGSDPDERYTWHERRLDNVERYAHETRGALSAVSSGLSDVKTSLDQLETRWVIEFGRIADVVEATQKALRDLAKTLKVGTVQLTDDEESRPAMHSLDYGEGPDTEMQDRPEVIGRMKVAERMNVSLEAQVAELRGQLRERDRQSERARTDASAAATRAAEAAKAADESALKTNELAIAKWKVTAGLIVGALMAIAAIGQAIASAFGG